MGGSADEEDRRKALAQGAPDDPVGAWFFHVSTSAREANGRANRLIQWLPSLAGLALLGFIGICTAMIIATRVHNTALLITGIVAGIPVTAALMGTIGYAIGQSRTVHRWVDFLDPAHARTNTTPGKDATPLWQ